MNINCCESGNTVTISLIGELDHHAARPTMNAIGKIIDSKLPRACVVDMSDISFMDSSGIAVLLSTFRKVSELGGEMTIKGASKQAGRIISAAGIDRIIKIG